MIVAIYARKSNTQDVADEAKSVARQIEHARQYALKKGWQVADAYIYVDDGISGAEFSNRPGFVRLMNALKPRAPFDVLIVSELSRLGREQLETGYAVKQLSQAGVKIVSYLEDREILLDTPTDKFLMSAVSFASEIEREKARQRTADAMLRKARAGHVCGGAVFGYRNREVVGPDGRRSHVEREIHEPEAVIVRRIFALCAAGKGIKAITKLLNAEGVPSPRPQQGRPRAWAPSSVRAVLHRDLYRGVATYNRTKQSDAWGQRATTDRPEADWVRVAVPALRIISDDEWHGAHRRIQNAAAVYLRGTNGHVWGRPPSDITSKYLLSGLMRCACCGQSMTVRTSAHGTGHVRRRVPFFICASYDHRGTSVCANGLRLPMADADHEILTKMRSYILDPSIVEGAIVDAIQELRPSRDAVDSTRDRCQAELRQLDELQARYVAALAAAGQIDALVSAMKTCEHDRRRVQHELAALDGVSQLTTFDLTHIERDLRSRLNEWRGLLTRQTPIARQVLSRLLDNRITWTPHPEANRYDYAGRVKFDRLLSGIVGLRKGSRPFCQPVGTGSPSGFTTSRGSAKRRKLTGGARKPYSSDMNPSAPPMPSAQSLSCGAQVGTSSQ